jgi:hypothetical protein
MNESLNIAQKCTGCAHLLDAGWKEPRCVDACPTAALKFLEEEEAEGYIAEAELLHPEDQKPRVYYQNIPKKFIAGTVYDPVKKEVVRNAICTLTGADSTQTTTTDGFGDFWFEGLEVGTYSLEISAVGYAARTLGAISTEQYVNLGDVPLG